jgi:rfaE bifunctional protein nucleotidyltransferase chain/domain
MIVTVEELPTVRKKHQTKTIALVFGAFDIIHVGHIEYLIWAKKQADVLVVSLLNDEQITTRKGLGRPVNKAEDRLKLMDNLKPVDYVVIRPQGDHVETALFTAKVLQPDIMILGSDWGPSIRSEHQATVPSAKVLIDPQEFRLVSTTNIISKIQTGPSS